MSFFRMKPPPDEKVWLAYMAMRAIRDLSGEIYGPALRGLGEPLQFTGYQTEGGVFLQLEDGYPSNLWGPTGQWFPWEHHSILRMEKPEEKLRTFFERIGEVSPLCGLAGLKPDEPPVYPFYRIVWVRLGKMTESQRVRVGRRLFPLTTGLRSESGRITHAEEIDAQWKRLGERYKKEFGE